MLYISHLGFYSDDWAFLSDFKFSHDLSFIGLVKTLHMHTTERPTQTIYLTSLYYLFGLNPIPYHLINYCVIICSIVFMCLTLKKLGMPKILILTVPLIYMLLPNYSTARFWYSAFVVNLCVNLYFISFYSDLRALYANNIKFWLWKLLASITLISSILAYDIIYPLFFVTMYFIILKAKELREFKNKLPIFKNRNLIIVLNIIFLIILAFFKIIVTDRIVITSSYIEHLERLLHGLINIHFLKYGIGIPVILSKIIYNYLDNTIFIVGFLCTLCVFIYLYCSNLFRGYILLDTVTWLKVIMLGLIVFIAGYCVFLLSSQVGFVTSGVDNRTAAVASIGVAAIFVGFSGLVSSFIPIKKFRSFVFSLLISTICFYSFITTNTISKFWVESYNKQKIVIKTLKNKLNKLPPNSTLLFDGMCPYIGPGIVFETFWDVSGILAIYYNDKSLKGDIIKYNTVIKENGIYTNTYGIERLYPYNENLLIFNFKNKHVYKLMNFKVAEKYFRQHNPDFYKRLPPGI